jgi:uncharacterized membrane protein YdbT with pleckstrin-like domain
MSYIDDSLVPGETVLHRAHVSWWSQAGFVILGLVLLVVVVGLFFLLYAWIRVHSTELAITNRRVIAKFGFIKRNTVEINLSKVEAVRVEQGFIGRLLDYGTILISGTGGSIEPLPSIADPLGFRRKFMEATDQTPARP